ncbi:MAG: rhomboid family intramembrane serine protease [Rhabdochlamydiaceae bacterium]|nr:rhomboid family intramembrane serine protease [Rhabdochlamydiaceae bacterium]
MRLIGSFDTEKQAYTLYSLLLKEGIQNTYEPFVDNETHAKRYRIWVYEENDLDTAISWVEKYKQHPEDPQFQQIETPLISSLPRVQDEDSDPSLEEPAVEPLLKRGRLPFQLTHLILAVCIFLFLWNDVQEGRLKAAKGELALFLTFTPLQKTLLFDDPIEYQQKIDQFLDTHDLKPYQNFKELPPAMLTELEQVEKAPLWKGVFDWIIEKRRSVNDSAPTPPLFEKIREHQYWRLVTPCFMHRDFFHLLFNMAWVWILGRQLDERLKPLKILSLALLIGIISNVAQYLMSGPFFMGYSGIIVGMAGFIWMRQRVAPWEGYPLSRGTVVFLLIFVLSMLALEWVTFGIELFSSISITPVVANTAHIVGGLSGMWLGRFNAFGRSVR